MPKPSINVFFDILSPYAYIAFHIINHNELFRQAEVTWTPVSLSTIMQACQNRPPIVIKNKNEYIDKDRIRVSKLFGVPMHPDMPQGFPVRTMEVMRHVAALSVISPEHLIPAVAALYDHFFVQLGDVVEPGSFLPVFERVLGAELLASVAGAAPDRGKEVLEKNTALALEKGAFGLPYFGATNSQGVAEYIWGVDHLYLAMEHIGLLPSSGASSGQG